jgi:hypothetical protein
MPQRANRLNVNTKAIVKPVTADVVFEVNAVKLAYDAAIPYSRRVKELPNQNKTKAILPA